MYSESLLKTIIDVDPGLRTEEIVYISNKIRNEIRRVDDPCMDNFRICKGENPTSDYEKQRNHGCCGFTDIVIKLKSGSTFHFGFNYGH